MEDWERQLILASVFDGLQSPYFDAFVGFCERHELSFVYGEVAPIVRRVGLGENVAPVPVATYEGLLVVAARVRAVMAHPGNELEHIHVSSEYSPEGVLVSATAEVIVCACQEWMPSKATAYIHDYLPLTKSGQCWHPGWRYNARSRLERIATALAIRRALPLQTRGIKILEEVEREIQQEINFFLPQPQSRKRPGPIDADQEAQLALESAREHVLARYRTLASYAAENGLKTREPDEWDLPTLSLACERLANSLEESSFRRFQQALALDGS